MKCPFNTTNDQNPDNNRYKPDKLKINENPILSDNDSAGNKEADFYSKNQHNRSNLTNSQNNDLIQIENLQNKKVKFDQKIIEENADNNSEKINNSIKESKEKDNKIERNDLFNNNNLFTTNMSNNEIKHLEENLKGQNFSSNNAGFINQGKSQIPNSSGVEGVSINTMKNSIRSLREFDKQAGNIYFKNTKNYGDETITNADFKSIYNNKLDL